MPICSYLLIPSEGASRAVTEALAALPGCDVVRAENHDVLLLVTDTPGLDEDRALRAAVEKLEGIATLVMVFGEVEPELAQ